MNPSTGSGPSAVNSGRKGVPADSRTDSTSNIERPTPNIEVGTFLLRSRFAPDYGGQVGVRSFPVPASRESEGNSYFPG